MDCRLFLFFIIAVLTSSLPAIFMKKYIVTTNNSKMSPWMWVVLSLISYMILIYCYSIILQGNDLGSYYAILKIMSVIFVVIVSVYFSEKLSYKKMFGLFIGLISVYILST